MSFMHILILNFILIFSRLL